MKFIDKLFITALTMTLASNVAFADVTAKFLDLSVNPSLTPHENSGLLKVKKVTANNLTEPFVAKDGSLNFVLGNQMPSIVCALFQVCDISLQAGEKLNSIEIGDSARWSISPAISGNGSNETIHILVKPFDSNLTTSIAIFTNKRAYHLKLKSHKTEYMPFVRFTYPDEEQKRWQQLITAKQNQIIKEKQWNEIPGTKFKLQDLDFNYRLTGNPNWKPTRIYNDGYKTYIQLPQKIHQLEIPTLLVISGNEEVLTNYKLDGNTFIVDSVFKNAVLVTGVGRKKSKVKITWEGAK